jgi:hypothetical protein
MKTLGAWPEARESGVSLLEVCIAVVILGIAGTLLMVNSRTSETGQQRSRIYGEAATATQEVLAEIQLLNLDSMSRLKNTLMAHSQGTDISVRATVRGVLAGDVDDFPGLDTTTLRALTLSTSFKSKSGRTVTKRFNTILYKP